MATEIRYRRINLDIDVTAIIQGKEKKLYYEHSTNTWFSIKKYLYANRFENPANQMS